MSDCIQRVHAIGIHRRMVIVLSLGKTPRYIVLCLFLGYVYKS
jgi:hypothetical protein